MSIIFTPSTDPWSLIENHRPECVTSWSVRTHGDSGGSSFTFSFTNLTFRLKITLGDINQTNCQIYDDNGLYPRRQLNPARTDVRHMIRNAVSVDEQAFRQSSPSLEIVILQALERIAEMEEETVKPTTATKGWSAAEISDWNEIVNNPFGLDVTTIRDTASAILGKTPEELVQDIPKEWRVIHMESVLRPDFVRRFKIYQDSLRSQLDEERSLNQKLPPHSELEGRVRSRIPRQEIIDDMIKPRITYHGTPLKNVASVIRYGFKMPGNVVNGKVVASPRSGIAFNRGIYSSQAPSYAISYASGQEQITPVGLLPSMRLFVCATIMGRTYRDKLGWSPVVHGPLCEGYDSHFDGRFEYIVHNERAMLPCYVIHLDLGSEEAKRTLASAQQNPTSFYRVRRSAQKERAHPRLAKRDMAPGDIKREQEARKAAASKWFPYGFGTATGTSFVIEEIGDVSDDEEEYGDWQIDKHTFEHDNTHVVCGDDSAYYDDWDEDGTPIKKKKGLFMDQYQQVIH